MTSFDGARGRKVLAVPAALLCIGVALVHVVDQGGFPGEKDPRYVGVGFYILELTAVLVAIALLSPRGRERALSWLLAAAVALGPLTGYVMSRGPGLPDYTDDQGNWAEPLGILSLAIEASLLVVGLQVLLSFVVASGAVGKETVTG